MADIDTLKARLDGMDKAINLLQAAADRSPTIAELTGDFGHLKELHGAKFVDNQRALDAALASQDKAIVKTEAGFTKQIDGLNEKIDDIKDRVTGWEASVRTLVISIGAMGTIVLILIAGLALWLKR